MYGLGEVEERETWKLERENWNGGEFMYFLGAQSIELDRIVEDEYE